MEQESVEKNIQDNLDNNNLDDKNYMVIHGKLAYGSRNKIYGLLSIIIDKDNGELINLDVAFSNKDEVVYIEPDSKAFDRIFSRISDKERLAGRKLKIYLLNNITQKDKFQSVDALLQGDLEQVEIILKSKLEDFIREAVELSIYGDFQTKEEIRYSHPNLLIDENDESENTEEEIIELDVTPVIAPINGKKISQFNKNDYILVQITEGSYHEHKDTISPFVVDANKRHIRGIIDYIIFNGPIKSYDIIIKFSSNIYSQLLIETEGELKLAIPPQQEEIDYELMKKEVRKEVGMELRDEIEQRLRAKLEAEIREELEEELTQRIEQELRIELEKEIRERMAQEKKGDRFRKEGGLFLNKLIINIFILLSLFILILLGFIYYSKKPL